MYKWAVVGEFVEVFGIGVCRLREALEIGLAAATK